MATENEHSSLGIDGGTVLGYVRVAVYVLTALLALSLLMVGTVGIIAEIKGT